MVVKNKKITTVRKVVQYTASAVTAWWLYCYLLGRCITKENVDFYGFMLGVVVGLCFISVFAARRWWQRILWLLVFIVLAAALVYWIGWDMNKFQF